MRYTITALFAAGLTIAVQAYPLVSSDTSKVELNVWNTGLAQAKTKAKALNRPTLMVMLDTVNCGYSKSWVSSIADTAAWRSFLDANPMVLVFADKTKLTSTTWYSYINPYRDSTGYFYFPTVVLFKPDGSVADQFLARSLLGSSPGFYNRVRKTTDQYPYTGAPPSTSTPGTIGFSLPALTVSESATPVSVTVNRLGGSSGAQTFSFSTAPGTAIDSVNFIGTSGSLTWADGDAAAKTIAVRLLNDNKWTSPTARTFRISLARTSGTATLGTSVATVTINESSPAPTGTPPVFTSPTPASGSTVSAVLNGAISIQVSATGSATVTYSAAGLPPGLAIDASSGLISGSPSSAGNSTVTVTASNSKGSAKTSFTLRVAIPSTVTAGSYQGFFYEPGQQTVRGTLTLLANAKGALKAQAVLGGTAYAFSGAWQAGSGQTAELQAKSTSESLDIQVDSLGILTGTFGDAALVGRRVDHESAQGFSGYYTSILNMTEATPNSAEIDNQPEGSGYVTFTVKNNGTVSYKGMLADGTPFNGASTLLLYSGTELAGLGYTDAEDDQSYACFPIYNTLYSKRGAVAAQVWIDAALASSSDDNKVFVAGSEWAYPGKSKSSPETGFTATFDDGTFTEIGAAYEQPQNLADVFADASFEVACGIALVQANGKSISLPSDNSLDATLSASTKTGLFSGKFLLQPETGEKALTVKYSGVLVPSLGIGGGFYLEPDNSIEGYKLQRSKPVVIAP